MLYARMPLAHDMIGIYGAVGNANHLPPWGGTAMLLSTNPISIAVPASKHRDIVLDMATTVASYGKVKTAAQRGETMPEGWMIDRQGRPLTDPKKASDGFLLPIGGPKGYGLSLMIGILAAPPSRCCTRRSGGSAPRCQPSQPWPLSWRAHSCIHCSPSTTISR